MTATIILGICLLVAIVSLPLGFFFLTKAHIEEKKELHDRLMARDYPEFMEGKDFQIELDKKKDEVRKKDPEKPKLSPEQYAEKFAAEQH